MQVLLRLFSSERSVSLATLGLTLTSEVRAPSCSSPTLPSGTKQINVLYRRGQLCGSEVQTLNNSYARHIDYRMKKKRKRFLIKKQSGLESREAAGGGVGVGGGWRWRLIERGGRSSG